MFAWHAQVCKTGHVPRAIGPCGVHRCVLPPVAFDAVGRAQMELQRCVAFQRAVEAVKKLQAQPEAIAAEQLRASFRRPVT